jgi:hypothetical protein
MIFKEMSLPELLARLEDNTRSMYSGGQQTADSKQQTSDSRQETADSRQYQNFLPDSRITPVACTVADDPLVIAGPLPAYSVTMVLEWC